jgi:uncharacterized membrane protein YgcG
MPIRQIAAAAAAFALATPLVAASTAHAASFFPGAVEATCISACLDQYKTYTQTFSASAFNGPVSINAFSFNRALLGSDVNSVFHVTFWTADGKEVGDLGHWMVGSLAGDKLTLTGDAFTFDPSLGPLIMKLQLDGYGPGGAGGGGGGGFSSGGGGGGGFSGGGSGASAGGALGGGGIYTTPGSVVDLIPPTLAQGPSVGGQAMPIPEPAGWALLILGFGGAGALLRSRRRLQTA